MDKFLRPSLSVRNWDDGLVGLDYLIINEEIKNWNKVTMGRLEQISSKKIELATVPHSAKNWGHWLVAICQHL